MVTAEASAVASAMDPANSCAVCEWSWQGTCLPQINCEYACTEVAAVKAIARPASNASGRIANAVLSSCAWLLLLVAESHTVLELRSNGVLSVRSCTTDAWVEAMTGSGECYRSLRPGTETYPHLEQCTKRMKLGPVCLIRNPCAKPETGNGRDSGIWYYMT